MAPWATGQCRATTVSSHRGQAGDTGRGPLLPRAMLTCVWPGAQGSAMSTCHIHVPSAKRPAGHHGPLYARQEQSLRSPTLPLASARCSPPPQKFLQLMGNPAASLISRGPGAGWGMLPWGAAPSAQHHLPEAEHHLWASSSQCCGERSQGDAGAQCPMPEQPQLSVMWCWVLHHPLHQRRRRRRRAQCWCCQGVPNWR